MIIVFRLHSYLYVPVGILPVWLTWEEEDKREAGGGGGVVGGGIGGVLCGLFFDNTKAGTGGGISFWLSSGVGIQWETGFWFSNVSSTFCVLSSTSIIDTRVLSSWKW